MITRYIEGIVFEAFSPSFYRVIGLPVAVHFAEIGWFVSEYRYDKDGQTIIERCHKRPFKTLRLAAQGIRLTLEGREVL